MGLLYFDGTFCLDFRIIVIPSKLAIRMMIIRKLIFLFLKLLLFPWKNVNSVLLGTQQYTALRILVSHSTATKIGCSVHCKIVQIRVILKYKLFTLNYIYALELIIYLLRLIKNVFTWLQKDFIVLGNCCLLAVSKKCLHERALLRTVSLWEWKLFSCSKISLHELAHLSIPKN